MSYLAPSRASHLASQQATEYPMYPPEERLMAQAARRMPQFKRNPKDLVVPNFEPKQGVTVEIWRAGLARAVEGLNSLSTVPWSERELYYATIPKRIGEASIWISMGHETLKPEDKTHSKQRERLQKRYGRYDTKMQVLQQVALRYKQAYDDYATALRMIGSGVNVDDDWYLSAFVCALGPTANTFLLGKLKEYSMTFNKAVNDVGRVGGGTEQELGIANPTRKKGEKPGALSTAKISAGGRSRND